ncbi:hypothetical protein HanRHA438_Chr08g0342601 [Helianthus annuus]|nr:hypothetical protein HanRHA438_Chr08g0342601 [Helianthus annuus]
MSASTENHFFLKIKKKKIQVKFIKSILLAKQNQTSRTNPNSHLKTIAIHHKTKKTDQLKKTSRTSL